jgi:hypothetical protein
MKAGSCHWILKTSSGAVGRGSLLLNSDSAGSDTRPVIETSDRAADEES